MNRSSRTHNEHCCQQKIVSRIRYTELHLIYSVIHTVNMVYVASREAEKLSFAAYSFTSRTQLYESDNSRD